MQYEKVLLGVPDMQYLFVDDNEAMAKAAGYHTKFSASDDGCEQGRRWDTNWNISCGFHPIADNGSYKF